MSKKLTERNEVILQLYEKGQTYDEIAHRFMITKSRVRQICRRQIRERDLCERQKELKAIREAERAERKAWREKCKLELSEGEKDCVIRNGTYDVFLTAIEDGPVYTYSSANIRDAMRFTMDDARRIARACRGRAIGL